MLQMQFDGRVGGKIFQREHTDDLLQAGLHINDFCPYCTRQMNNLTKPKR